MLTTAPWPPSEGPPPSACDATDEEGALLGLGGGLRPGLVCLLPLGSDGCALKPVVGGEVSRGGRGLLLALALEDELPDEGVGLVEREADGAQQERPEEQDLAVDGAGGLDDLDGAVEEGRGAHLAGAVGVEHGEGDGKLAGVQGGVGAEAVEHRRLAVGLHLQPVGLVREVLDEDAEVEGGVEGPHDGGDVVGLRGAVVEADDHLHGVPCGSRHRKATQRAIRPCLLRSRRLHFSFSLSSALPRIVFPLFSPHKRSVEPPKTPFPSPGRHEEHEEAVRRGRRQ